MDPILALGLASNVAQFIDFGLKATSKAREIQKSAGGVTAENADLEFIVKDLVAVNAKLNTSVGSYGEAGPLEALCQKCAQTADQLISALESFKPEGKRTKWKSARKALKTLWGREAVEEMKSRLLGFRDQLQVHILVRMKGELDLLAVQQTNRFNELDDQAKKILADLITSRESLTQSLQEHEESNRRRHSQSQNLAENQHLETRTGVIRAVNGAAESTDTQFHLMRQEIENVNKIVAKTQQDISQALEEVNRLTRALVQAQSDKHRRKLQEGKRLATETLNTLISVYQVLTTLLGNLKVQAAALAASIGFAHLWRAQEMATVAFSFQRPESSMSTATNLQKEGNEDVRQGQMAVLCSNYYYYYFPLCRRRHIIPKQRIIGNLNAIHPVDADTEAQFPNLPLLFALNQAEWRPNFSWAIRGSVELPLLFYLPTPGVAYDFLAMAIAFSAVMPQVTDEAYAENILSELFGNSTYLSAPPGSAQRQRIKKDYRDWQKIAGLLWLDDLFAACHEESCILWQTEPSEVRMIDSASNRDSEPLLIRFWLWLMGGWSTCFSFEVPHNGDAETLRRGMKDTQNTDFILVHAVAEFLVRSSYQINLQIEQNSDSLQCVKISFVGQQNLLSVPAPAMVPERGQSPVPGE